MITKEEIVEILINHSGYVDRSMSEQAVGEDNFQNVADSILSKLKHPSASCSLPMFKDWGYLQEEAYDECMGKLITDDAPITAFIEWLQKKYPNGVNIVL
jgi:hypothetical protein